MIKILQTQGFSSLVFVFPESWRCVILSVSLKMSVSSPEIQNASYFFKSSTVNSIHDYLEYIMFKHNPFQVHMFSKMSNMLRNYHIHA